MSPSDIFSQISQYGNNAFSQYQPKHYGWLFGSITAIGFSLYGIRRYFAGGTFTSDVRLDGKTVLITGCNTGIGKETARDMAARGARVIFACRDVARAQQAAEEIREETGNTDLVVHILDLSSLESVRRFCKVIKDTESQLDILINNAGVMACPHWRTAEGFELQLGTNHLGHFLLTHELLDLLKASAPSRVVNVSSLAHSMGNIHFDDLQLEKSYEPWKAYYQSKLANVLFTRELHQRLKGTGVTTYSLHPGVITTDLWRHLPGWFSFAHAMFRIGFKTAEEGAQTTNYCALAEGIEKHSGKYFRDCKLTKTAPQGEDDDAASRLWEISEQLVGIKPEQI